MKVLLYPPWKWTFWTTKVMEVDGSEDFPFQAGEPWQIFRGVARACPGPKRIFHLPTIDFQYIFRGLLLLVSGRVSLTKGAVWSLGRCKIIHKLSESFKDVYLYTSIGDFWIFFGVHVTFVWGVHSGKPTLWKSHFYIRKYISKSEFSSLLSSFFLVGTRTHLLCAMVPLLMVPAVRFHLSILIMLSSIRNPEPKWPDHVSWTWRLVECHVTHPAFSKIWIIICGGGTLFPDTVPSTNY